MAAVTCLLKANTLLLSKPGHGNTNFNNRSVNFRESCKFGSVRAVKNFMYRTSATKIDTNFEFEEPQFIRRSNKRGNNPCERGIIKSLMKWLKIIPVATTMMLLSPLMYGRRSALASPAGSSVQTVPEDELCYREGELADLFAFLYAVYLYANIVILFEQTRVIKFQVGLPVSEQSDLQCDLDRITKTVYTRTSRQSSYIWRGTIDSLLRHYNHWIFGNFSVNVVGCIEHAVERFMKLSNDRGKLNEETLVDFNNMEKQCITSAYIVVTVAMAIAGPPLPFKLPETITSRGDLETALKNLRGLHYIKLKAVDLYWTLDSQSERSSEELGSISWLSMMWHHCKNETRLWRLYRRRGSRYVRFSNDGILYPPNSANYHH